MRRKKQMTEKGSANPYPEKVILKILAVKGTCAAGHQKGQEFEVAGSLFFTYKYHSKHII
jgi:hypothetical protein